MARWRTSTLTYETLTEKKRKFIDRYLETGDRNEAYLFAGYSPSRKSHRANARLLYIELHEIIQSRIESKIGEGAVTALNVILDMMQNSSSDAVRLQCAKDYLWRAGYDKPIESKITIDDLRDLDDSALADEIKALVTAATTGSPAKSVH